jgi:acyl dehydratase
MNSQELLREPARVTRHRYTKHDTMLYALGIGAGGDPGLPNELRYVYEEGLQTLPSMAAVLATPGFWQREPRYAIDWKQLLHGEQSVCFHAPLPVEGTVRSEMTVDAIYDKGVGKGALLHTSRRVIDESTGTWLASVKQVSFLRGDGGCGGSSGAPPKPHPIPNRSPDAQIALTTRPEQALIYRLSGDYNPVHADPGVAQEAGLPGPILHGLCTYGFAVRALLKLIGSDEPARLKRVDCRFTSPVFPGDTLTIAVWREVTGRAAFRVHVPKRGALVLNNGYAEIEEN